MDVTIDANEPSANFRRILSMIEQAGEFSIDGLTEYGDCNSSEVDSLEVDKYTFGPRFFHYRSREREELHKRVMAKSFLDHAKMKLETIRDIEKQFQEWEDVAFPQKFFSDHEKEYHQYEYHKRGNFIVECLFIIEVIRRFSWSDKEDAKDELNSIRLFLQARRDMMVYGNQLPFYVLEAVFNLAGYKDFLNLCITFFGECMLITNHKQVSPIIKQLLQQENSGSEIKDFIDLLRKCHAPIVSRQPPTDPLKRTTTLGAYNLKKAGLAIRLAPADLTVCSLCYSKGQLKIPKLRISNKSRHLLTNSMEYEMRHYPQETFIIDYVHFIASLIRTSNDVDILINNNILDNCLSDSYEVISLFISITEEAPSSAQKYYYHGISEAVNDYCRVHQHKWKSLFGFYIPALLLDYHLNCLYLDLNCIFH